MRTRKRMYKQARRKKSANLEPESKSLWIPLVSVVQQVAKHTNDDKWLNLVFDKFWIPFIRNMRTEPSACNPSYPIGRCDFVILIAVLIFSSWKAKNAINYGSRYLANFTSMSSLSLAPCFFCANDLAIWTSQFVSMQPVYWISNLIVHPISYIFSIFGRSTGIEMSQLAWSSTQPSRMIAPPGFKTGYVTSNLYVQMMINVIETERKFAKKKM